MVKRVFPFVAVFLLIAGCQKKVDIKESAIVVNGHSISRAKVDQAAEMLHQNLIQAFPNRALQPMGPEIVKAAAYQLVSNYLMIEEAKKRNIPSNSARVDSTFEMMKKRFPDEATFEKELAAAGQTKESMKEQITSGMMLDSLLKQILKSVDTVKEEECMAMYEKNKDKYVSRPKVKASQFLIPFGNAPTQAKKDECMKEATDALKSIKAGTTFDNVVKKYAKAGAIGGDIGWFQKGDLKPQIEEIIERLNQGQISEPVPIDVGVVIVQKTGEEAGSILPYEKVKDHVKFMADMKKKNDFISSFVDGMIKKAKIAYNDTTLTPLSNDSMDKLFKN